MNSSAPSTTLPPEDVVSTTTSAAKTLRIASQSFVSIVRKYRAFTCLIPSRWSIETITSWRISPRDGASWSAEREELPRLLQELGTQALVLEIQDERVDDGPCDARREHRCLNPCPGVGGTAHQHAVHTLHHAPEGRVFLEEAQHDRVALENARHVAALDGEVDHVGDQHLPRS